MVSTHPLGSTKAIQYLKQLFSSSDRHDDALLCWILFSPKTHEQDNSDAFKSLIKTVQQIESIRGTLSTRQLLNTSPARARRGSIGLRGTPASLLVFVDSSCSVSSYNADLQQLLAPNEDEPDDKNNAVPFSASWRWFRPTQRIEGRQAVQGPGKCIVSVAIEPGPGQDEDIDSWYRKEYMPMLSKTPLFLHSRRLERLEEHPGRSSFEVPKFLALNEFVSVQSLFDYSIRHGRLVPETERSIQVFDNAKSFERTIWSTG